jgi:hypothetical protein
VLLPFPLKSVVGQMSCSAVPSTSQGSGPWQTGKCAGPGLHRALALAQHPCIPVCELCSWPVFEEGGPEGCAAVLHSSCIFHSLSYMVDFLCSSWAQALQDPHPQPLCL